MRQTLFAIIFVFVCGTNGRADGYASPPIPNTGNPPLPPNVGIDQKLGDKVPLDLPFRNEKWKIVSLGECMAGKPTVLVMAYYRCPMLCNQVLNGVLKALEANRDDVGSTFNVVVVSFDPREKPPLAALKKATYLEQYDRPGSERGWHFLTGDSLAIGHLADAVGFRYEYDKNTQQYAHRSGIMILAPDGTISRYFLGIDYDASQLGEALAGASRREVSGPVEAVASLLCYRDEFTGTYSLSVLKVVRLVSGLTILMTIGLVSLQIRRSRRHPRPELILPTLEA